MTKENRKLSNRIASNLMNFFYIKCTIHYNFQAILVLSRRESPEETYPVIIWQATGINQPQFHKKSIFKIFV